MAEDAEHAAKAQEGEQLDPYATTQRVRYLLRYARTLQDPAEKAHLIYFTGQKFRELPISGNQREQDEKQALSDELVREREKCAGVPLESGQAEFFLRHAAQVDDSTYKSIFLGLALGEIGKLPGSEQKILWDQYDQLLKDLSRSGAEG